MIISPKRENILNETLERIIPVLIEHYTPEKIILFRSMIGGSIHEASDIDLLLIKESEKRPLDRVMEVSALLGYPGVAIDIFVYTPEEIKYLLEQESPFIGEIIEQGKVLYEKDH